MNLPLNPAIQNAASFLKIGDYHSARKILIARLVDDPDDEIAWFFLSYVVEAQADKSFALNQVLRINPNNQRAKFLLEASDERKFVSKVSSIDLAPEEERLAVAAFQIEDGDILNAKEALREVLNANHNSAQAWYLLTKTAVNQSELKVYLRQVLRVDPSHLGAKQRLSELEPLSTTALVPDISTIPTKWDKFIIFGKYFFKKITALFATVVIGVYLTVLVANLWGNVDEIFEGMIAQQIMGFVMGGGLDDIPEEEQDVYLEELEWGMEEAMGLHEPFLIRSFRFLFHGLTLNFGETFFYYFFGGVMHGADQTVQSMVLKHLPYTLVLVGISNLFVFFLSISFALFLSRKYGSWMDRISAALAALSSAPSWIFGIILILILAGQLQILPFPKVIDLEFADYSPRFIELLISQLIMPVIAIFLSAFFQGVYTWRTFFLIYSQEDYVEMGRALGLPSRKIQRQYILKPTFPYVITNFAMMMILVWESSIALEILFYWPGIGPLFLNAVNRFNTSLILAIVVVFAYLLAITVFLLDLIYGVIDPRIRLGHNGQNMLTARRKLTFSQGAKRIIESIREGVKSFISLPGILLSFFRIPFSYHLHALKNSLKSGGSVFKEIKRFPSAIVGLMIIILLVFVSIYTIITIPYNEAVESWRTHTTSEGESAWEKNPRNASPSWVNVFRLNKLPETIQLKSTDPAVSKTYESVSEETTEITIIYEFEYPYEKFPDELTLFFNSQYQEKKPHVSIMWLTPDRREIRVSSFSIERNHIYRIAQDEKLQRKVGGKSPQVGLFADLNSDEDVPLQGIYELRINAIVFEVGSDVDCELVLYGRVYGIAGTDNHRRDLKLALMWGTPVALAFGLIGAIGTSLVAMVISAVGVWFGGWVDALIQRITEINIILPTLPIAIMIYIMYSKTIWVVLGVIILLNIFGSSIKNYRAAFLQVKESAYIEGAIAYGAKGGRIITQYMIPRILPVLLPQLVIMVPGFVFYEATLAYLGLSDPHLPTWGKVAHDALTNGAYVGHYYWILEPIGLLLATGLAFALLGFALDRVINPRLREM